MADFATVFDLEDRWRPLSPVEASRAWVLIGDASRKLRSRAKRYRVDLDARIAAGDLGAQDVAAVVVAMVKRVMLSGDADGIESLQQTAGPFGVSAKYSNPMGNLYVTAQDLADLGIVTTKRAYGVDLGPSSLPAAYY